MQYIVVVIEDNGHSGNFWGKSLYHSQILLSAANWSFQQKDSLVI